GGILWETFDNYLSVHPATLRYALIRDVFFHGAYSLPIQSFIDHSPSITQAAKCLVGAYRLGAKIPRPLLLEILIKANSIESWSLFASSGENEASWVLENYPKLAVPLGHPILMNTPEKAISILFQESIGDDRQMHSNPDHPLRIIDDWVKNAWPGSKDVIFRRKLIIRASINWLQQGKPPRPSFLALRIAYNPACMTFTADPGSGNTITIRQSYLHQEEMEYLWDQWPEVFNTIKSSINIEWIPLQELVRSWAFPELSDIHISTHLRVRMKKFATKIISDLVSMRPNSQGLLRWAKSTSKNANLELSIKLDPVFEIFFPIEKLGDWKRDHDRQIQKIKKLAVKWSREEQSHIILMIVEYEREAAAFDINWPRLTPQFCIELSQNNTSPEKWVKEMMTAHCQADLIAPFLHEAGKLNAREWQDLIFDCLKTQEYSGLGISIALQNPFSSDQLVDEIFEHLSGCNNLIQTLCLRNEIPERIIQKLLRHPDPKIAGATAIGLWMAKNDDNKISELFIEDWQNAIIHSKDHHFIYPILAKNPDLAFEWLLKYLQGKDFDIFESGVAVKSAISALDQKAKKLLLDIIPAFWEYGQIVEYLIGNDLVLYQFLLQNERLSLFHNVPLVWCEGEGWIKKARLAINHGISPMAIAQAVCGYPFKIESWSGHESKMREKWVNIFEQLCQHSDPVIREIGAIGKESAEDQLKKALEGEYNEEVFGHHSSYRKYSSKRII
ncbi:MAG TPA: hypothetical protein VGK38_09430, partial [Prolixibacteraceae bacterium]